MSNLTNPMRLPLAARRCRPASGPYKTHRPGHTTGLALPRRVVTFVESKTNIVCLPFGIAISFEIHLHFTKTANVQQPWL